MLLSLQFVLMYQVLIHKTDTGDKGLNLNTRQLPVICPLGYSSVASSFQFGCAGLGRPFGLLPLASLVSNCKIKRAIPAS